MRPITAKLESRKRISLTVPIVLWFLIIGVSLFGYSVMMGYVDLDRIIDSLWPYHDRMTLAWYKHGKMVNTRAALLGLTAGLSEFEGSGGNSGTIGLVSHPNKQIMGHAWCCRRCQDHFIFTSAVQLEMKVRVLEGWLPS